MAKKENKNQKDKTSFAKSFKAELKRVVWPTPKQLFNNTAAVLAIVVITAIIVFALDFTFNAMNKYGIDKIKQVVSNTTDTANTTENETTENNSDEESNNIQENVTNNENKEEQNSDTTVENQE